MKTAALIALGLLLLLAIYVLDAWLIPDDLDWHTALSGATLPGSQEREDRQ